MAARAAGMKTVAVTNSYPRERLLGLADYVVDSLLELTPEIMENVAAAIPNGPRTYVAIGTQGSLN
jgi:beta-phosphoglucomutase-like phosphatase (HAD superfamily)